MVGSGPACDDPLIVAAPTYDLPTSAIAQHPVEPRDAARLLVDRGTDLPPEHRHVRDLPSLVQPGDVLVLNDSKVLPARLRLTKATGGAVEVLLLEERDDHWEALVRPGRRVPPGTRLVAGPDLTVEVGEAVPGGDDSGIRAVRLVTDDPVGALARHGVIPLPHYIHETLADPDRYQTVYARNPGSVAAPTAGLHVTEDVLARCRAAGAEIVTVDLAVGMGTFRPVTAERIEDHGMHEERYVVPASTLAACRHAERVVAIGTTSVRALETAAITGELSGRTRLLIAGDHPWQLVDALLTNFHQPASTLLCLVESFIGARWRDLYALALAEGYRFLSFGDAMFIERQPGSIERQPGFIERQPGSTERPRGSR
ncbi:MAG TPA: tRNA preQ1(34) S-adenosylmethionine ribosyltransferase-isomerase QueA [Acidimicrobiales bacterium]